MLWKPLTVRLNVPLHRYLEEYTLEDVYGSLAERFEGCRVPALAQGLWFLSGFVNHADGYRYDTFGRSCAELGLTPRQLSTRRGNELIVSESLDCADV